MSELTLAGASTAFLTDQYELTMVQAALESGAAFRPSIFEVFGRRLAPGRRYGVVAGTGRLLEALKDFRFTDSQLRFLADRKILNDATLDYLRDFEFSGHISGYAEGEVYFPGSPVLTVEAGFADAVVLETLILSVLNYDSAVASAASRMRNAAGTRNLAEMGSRRTNEQAALAAARASVIAGFEATSNLAAGMRYDLQTLGTSAHSFTLIHDSEKEAFGAQVQALGKCTTLLLDTYDVGEALRAALAVAGTDLGGVRLDSGDLAGQATEVRQALDAAGATQTTITVTSDLDEYAIAGLAAAPVDAYGVGTRLVTGSGAPTASFVYKLVAHTASGSAVTEHWQSVAKKSASKSSRGGRKFPLRLLENGIAIEEAIGISALPDLPEPARPLSVDYMVDGVIDDSYTGAAGVRLARAQHAQAVAELPRSARRLQDGEPAIATVYYPAVDG